MPKKYHRSGKTAMRPIIRTKLGGIYAEHVLTIWQLYKLDELTMSEIADIYGTYTSNVQRVLSRMSKAERGEGEERYFMRAQKYAEALKLLNERRGCPYKVIADETGAKIREVRVIAIRNGLEREHQYYGKSTGSKAGRRRDTDSRERGNGRGTSRRNARSGDPQA